LISLLGRGSGNTIADPVGIAGRPNSLSFTQFIPDRRGKQVIQIFFDIE
jgi:hypothetical protein